MKVDDGLNVREIELIRQTFASLRTIASLTPGQADRAVLLELCARLVPDGSPKASLSAREIDVLACTATGKRNSEIAEVLHLKPSTVKSYLRSALDKLGATNRHEAVVAARHGGLLP